MTATCPHCGKQIEPMVARSGGLTHMQYQALEYIVAHIGVAGVAPSYDEIAYQLGLKSKSGVHRLIEGLEARGRIRRHPRRARGIEILEAA